MPSLPKEASSDNHFSATKTLIVLLGPTAVGKSELALTIASHLNVPIINADSRQIYAELPIGTAAPTKEQLARATHFFVGTLHLSDYYSASMFENDVLSLLEQLFRDSQTAFMCGGSMMYIDAVCNGIDDIPTIPDNVRLSMRQRLQAEGLNALCNELALMDPAYYNIVDKNNWRRVVHALEICHTTGTTYSSFRTNTRKQRPFNILKIGINRERETLYHRINKRVTAMIAHGLVTEALSVYPFRNLNALNTVGYKEMFDYLDGLCSLDYAIQRIQSNTRKYCRKQLTWFKRDNDIIWLNPDNVQEILNLIDAQIR